MGKTRPSSLTIINQLASQATVIAAVEAMQGVSRVKVGLAVGGAIEAAGFEQLRFEMDGKRVYMIAATACQYIGHGSFPLRRG